MKHIKDKFIVFFRNISIREKLLLLFSIQIIIPLLFMAITLYQTSRNVIRNKSIDYSNDILKMIELRINDFSNNVKGAAQDLLYDRDIYDILSEEKEISDYEQIYKVNNILRKTCLSRKEIQSIALISNNQIYFTYDSNVGRASIEKLVPYDEMKKVAKKAEGKAVWFLDIDNDGNVKNLFITRSIIDISNYEEVGLMAILIKKDSLGSVYGELSKEFIQSIAIVSEKGNVILGSGDRSFDLYNSLEKLEFSKDNNNTLDNENNALISFANMKEPSWKIITEISISKLDEDLDTFRNYFIIILVCTVLILSVLSILVAIDIINPINKLVVSIKAMQEDKTHQEIIVDRNDELGYLSKCFNDMSREIDMLVNRVYKEQLTRKEAEIKTLQAQINPHFLFNTLESINWMAHLKDAPEISEMVTALSSLMEVGIGKQDALVSVSEELNFIDSYILIMKNRYGKRLIFEKIIDQRILSVKVPKLILQPLVENAIYHGIGKMRRRGKILLRIKRFNDEILIEVKDNGKGMESEEVKRINEILDKGSDDYLFDNKSKIGIGLKNVNRRIKLFYGQKYGIILKSEYGEYLEVVVKIPADTEIEGAEDYV